MYSPHPQSGYTLPLSLYVFMVENKQGWTSQKLEPPTDSILHLIKEMPLRPRLETVALPCQQFSILVLTSDFVCCILSCMYVCMDGCIAITLSLLYDYKLVVWVVGQRQIICTWSTAGHQTMRKHNLNRWTKRMHFQDTLNSEVNTCILHITHSMQLPVATP